MRPSAADILAAQVEQTPASSKQTRRNDTRLSPLYSSAPPTSSTSDLGHSPSSYASSRSPLTPATPWTAEDSPEPNKARTGQSARGNETGLGLSGMNSGSAGKLSGRGGVSKARAELEEEELDDELEDELNDFGYGSRVTRKKEKKESLLDMLNSEPPSWLTEAEPVPVSLPRKGSLPSKIRKKFSSSAIDNDLQSNFTTLQRGGSKSRKEDTSPLRSSRSAGNLLNSFRSRTTNFGFKISGGGGSSSNRSRENLQGSIDLGSHSSHSKNGSRMLDEEEFERLINVPSSTRRLTAKEGVSSSPATRDLADFLRSNGSPFEKSKSSVSLATTEASSVLTNSTAAKSFGSLEDNRTGGGGSDNPSIVRAAMVKLGAAGRRASLGTSTSFQNLVNSNRPSTSSGIPRLSPTQSKLKRPSTAQTVASQESAYDPLNKEMIQVDDSLMRGMFGGPREKDKSQPKGEEEEERLRDSQVQVGTPPSLGVYEFVAIDERESGGKSPELHRLGSLTKSKSLGNVSTVRRPSSSSGSNSTSTTKLPSPRRKPVPLAEEPSPRAPRTSSSSKLRALPEREDTSPFTTGESPVKGALPSPSPVGSLSSAPFSSLVPTSDVQTPTSLFEMYSTPPLTPATPSSVKLPSTSPLKQRNRATSAQSQSQLDNPSSLPPTSPLPRVPDSRSSSQTSSRKDAFRPRSMLLQPSESVSKRLSSLPSLEPNENSSSTSTPPTTLPQPSIAIDEPVFAALDSLRACMSQTASLPVNTTSLEELVPTLKGLQQSMEHGSKLLGAILARFDDRRDTKGEEEGKLVGMLLGGEEWESESSEHVEPLEMVSTTEKDNLDRESLGKIEDAIQA